MATSTTKTNKPINPRGNDQSPKGYNRAALYSGKALDFDGVNDYVEIDSFAGTLSDDDAWTLCGYFKANENSGTSIWFSAHTESVANVIRVGVRENELGLFYDDSHLPDSFIGTEDLNNDEWHFVALSRPQGGAGTEVTLYVNGIASGTLETDITWNVATKFSIGQEWDYNGASDFFDGQITNTKLFNTALTAAQVADLYNNPEKIVPTGVSNTALKLWLPMMEGAGTTAINGAPDALGSEMIINGDFSDGTNDWTFGSAFSVVNGKAYYNDSASGNQIYQSNLTFSTSKNYVLTFDISDATDAVIWVGNGAGTNAYTINASYHTYNNGHYSLFLRGSDIGASETTLGIWANPNGAAFSIDNISLKEVANCGTISGATWTHGVGSPVAQTSVIDWNKWKLEGGSTTNEYLIPQGLTAGRDLLDNLFENVRKQGALNLDGNSWAEVHDNASLDFGTGAFTLEAWARAKYVSQGSSLNAIMTLGGALNGAGSIGIILSGGIRPISYYNTDATIATGAQNEGDWFHIVGTYDGSIMSTYINGVFSNSHSRTAADITNDLVKMIGRDTTTVRNYNDQLAQPRIYNRALTAEEVARNYNASTGIYQ